MSSRKIYKYGYLFFALLLFNRIVAQPDLTNLDTIRLRFCRFAATEATRITIPEPVTELVASQKTNGSWKGFNYTEKPPVHLPAIAHLSRLVKMAIAYSDSSSAFYKQEAIGKAIHNGLQYWLQVKPQSQNWWYNVIGTPAELAKILLLMDAELTENERKEGLAWLMIANKNGVLKTVKAEATGQNMIWIATLQMQAACISRSADYMRFAIENVRKEMKISTGEGIQPDYSFHQHGRQLYAGGYGLAFAVDCSRIAYILRHTAFALPDSIINNLSNYILQGQQWMIWNGKMDYGTMGREIARPGKSATPVATACNFMAALNTPQQPAFEALAKSIQTKGSSGYNVTGNHYFPNSDFMVHRRKNFYVSVKMSSERTVASESGNGEAEQNFHMGNGNMFILRNGKEYEDIFPLWDWQKIPGITNRIRTAEALPLITFGSGARGHTNFVGGVSDSVYGAAAFDLNLDSVTGKKAWFFFDKEIVCLGAGLAVQMEAPLTTGINQCFAKGPVAYQEKNKEETLTKKTVKGPVKWVYHDSIAYFFEDGSQVQVQQENKHASWSVINRTMADPPTQSGAVFSLWLNHNMAANRHYAYTIVPAISLSECRQYRSEKQYRILSNTTVLQAVQQLQDSIVQIVFWQAGKLHIDDFGELSVDKPCMVMLRKKGRQVYISVSDPTGDNSEINVHLTSGAKTKQLTFHLPGAEMAGRTVSQQIEGL